MEVVHSIEEIRREVRNLRNRSATIGFVPTMGNLHAGHLSLVKDAAASCGAVVVSIYVNPMQFGPTEDFSTYPRTLEQDLELLREAGTITVFQPDDEAMYPHGTTGQTFVEVPLMGEMLCGAARPGHFRGVSTVVARLLNIVQPDLAVFGKKDYQQLAIIRRMVADLAIPVEIVGGETIRAEDGLALSSRNRYLTAEQRRQAPCLYASLLEAAEQVRAGRQAFAQIEQAALQELRGCGFQPDYVAIRRQQDLQPAGAGDRVLVVLAAARLGQARLIDNVEIVL